MNFAQANSLRQGRYYESRKVGNHVYLRRRNHAIAVQIHSSDKLLFTPDGRVILATKWFSDLAIRDRINGFLPEPWLVCRWRNHTILYRAQDGYKNGWSVDGLVVINMDGTLKCKGRPRRGSLRPMSEVLEEVRELDRERNRPRQKLAAFWLPQIVVRFHDRVLFFKSEIGHSSMDTVSPVVPPTLRMCKSRWGNGISMFASRNAFARPTVTSLLSRNQSS
jgi:hypothetical protein